MAHRFIPEFRELAAAVRVHEPHTLGYTLAQSDQDALEYMIFERYTSKEAYVSEHRAKSHFQQFRPKLKALEEAGDVEIQGHSFNEMGIGHI